MRKITTVLAAMLLALSMLAGSAVAQEGPPPFHIPHTHVKLLHADVLDQFDPNTGAPYTVLSYGKCVDLAGGKALKHNRFHDNIHFGQAGQALRGAGHIVLPFSTCATVDEDWGIGG